MLFVASLGLPVWGYYTIYYLLLYLLGLSVHGGANLCTRVGFLQLRARGRSLKTLRFFQVHLHLSATPLPQPPRLPCLSPELSKCGPPLTMTHRPYHRL